jgi:antitoxin ParD1/3/4/toxin ParE1/3/4
MNRLVLTKPARRDLDQIKSFLLEKAGPRITRRVIKDIRAALQFLGKEPGAGHLREDLTRRPVKFWPVYSYLIVYDPKTKPIQILRILHGMRDLEEILTITEPRP